MAQAFYPTAQQTIDDALRTIAAVDPEGGITPTTTQRTDALRFLNYLVTSWQAHGMQVWCQKIATMTTMTAATNWTVGPSGDINIQRPLSVQQVWLRTLNDPQIDTPVEIIGREEYFRLSAKEATGRPTHVFYDPEYDLPGGNNGANAKGRMYVYPMPDATAIATYALQFVYTRPIQDFSAVGDYLDFPQEWFNAVRLNLALMLCPEYSVPLNKWDRIKKEAQDALNLALSWDRENASFFISPAHG